jgi:hypothetical protein
MLVQFARSRPCRLARWSRLPGGASADEALDPLSSFNHHGLDLPKPGGLAALVQHGPDDVCDEVASDATLQLRGKGRRHPGRQPHLVGRDGAPRLRRASAGRGATTTLLNQGSWTGRPNDGSARPALGRPVPELPVGVDMGPSRGRVLPECCPRRRCCPHPVSGGWGVRLGVRACQRRWTCVRQRATWSTPSLRVSLARNDLDGRPATHNCAQGHSPHRCLHAACTLRQVGERGTTYPTPIPYLGSSHRDRQADAIFGSDEPGHRSANSMGRRNGYA